MMLSRLFAAVGMVLGLGMAQLARADVVINVDQGVTAPLPIAVVPFAGAQGAQIAEVMSADLERSDFFKPLDAAVFPAPTPTVDQKPGFDGWKALGAQVLVVGAVLPGTEGRIRVVARAWDVYAGEQIVGAEFTGAPDSWRRIAHKVADAIYVKLTGGAPYFDTRIAFVAESGGRARTVRRLSVMDQDGANVRTLGDGGGQVFSPRYALRGQDVVYMVLRDAGTTLMLRNLETGREESLGRLPGQAFGPRFSPDGRRIVFSLAHNGNTDVYLMDLAGHSLSRLTDDPNIDTSPSFSPDGSQIVFNSDRGGSRQLYVMNADGGAVHRISFGSGHYTTPVWSPDGKFIAFTKQEGAVFHIGVMRPDGSDERILTSSYLDEGPAWAPNSRVIAFSRETPGGGAHLWSVDIAGHPAKPSTYPLGASDPSWSSLLP
jgi:TolB protein